MMTKVPMKPPITKDHRRGETFSPKDLVAHKVITKGAVNTMDVNSATGMYLRLKKANKLMQKSRNPRNIWNRGWRVCKILMPRVGSTTKVVATAWKKYRNHKAISKDKLVLMCLVVVSSIEKQATASKPKPIPASTLFA